MGSKFIELSVFFYDFAIFSFGLCNLRDVKTGEFVDFSDGQNGFTSDRSFCHTVVNSSSLLDEPGRSKNSIVTHVKKIKNAYPSLFESRYFLFSKS